VTAGTDVNIETANPEQAVAWNENEGEHCAEHADRSQRIGSTIWQRSSIAHPSGAPTTRPARSGSPQRSAKPQAKPLRMSSRN
jgi:hypothetical protein